GRGGSGGTNTAPARPAFAAGATAPAERGDPQRSTLRIEQQVARAFTRLRDPREHELAVLLRAHDAEVHLHRRPGAADATVATIVTVVTVAAVAGRVAGRAVAPRQAVHAVRPLAAVSAAARGQRPAVVHGR